MSSVERIHVEPNERPHYGVPPEPPPQPAPAPPVNPYIQQIQHVQRQAAVNARVVGLMNAVAMIVSARLLLLLATCFGFVLALQAEGSQTRESIAVLIAWSVLTVLPLVVLDVLARQPMKQVQ